MQMFVLCAEGLHASKQFSDESLVLQDDLEGSIAAILAQSFAIALPDFQYQQSNYTDSSTAHDCRKKFYRPLCINLC
jgi:dsDNA-specific endonuclease/ATPase MutS2